MSKITVSKLTLSASVLILTLSACQTAPRDGSAAVPQTSPVQNDPVDPITTPTDPATTVIAAPDANAQTAATTPDVVVVAPPAAPVVSQYPSSLTYYTITGTQMLNNRTTTAVMKGSCVVWGNDTYCWDDGIKVVSVAQGSRPAELFNFSFWGMTSANVALNVPYGACSGNCQVDFMTTPNLMTASLETAASDSFDTVRDVLANGTAKTVSCTHHDSELDCGDFVIALNQ